MRYTDTMSPWAELKERLLEIRGGQCELCGGQAQELDHALIPKAHHRMGKRMPKELNEEFNAILLCQRCNQEKPAAYWQPHRSYIEWAMERLIGWYGEPCMREWWSRVPLKTKPVFESMTA